MIYPFIAHPSMFSKSTCNQNEKVETISKTVYSRLITAAVVNKQFRKMLLTNPSRALELGCNSESFNLCGEEKDRVLAIRAASLEDFADKLVRFQPATIPQFASCSIE